MSCPFFFHSLPRLETTGLFPLRVLGSSFFSLEFVGNEYTQLELGDLLTKNIKNKIKTTTFKNFIFKNLKL